MVDIAVNRVHSRDLGALSVPAWMPDGDLVVVTWMGTVTRFDVNLQEKWQVQLAGASLAQPVATPDIPTTRLTIWSNTEPTPLSLTPNLLDAKTAVRGINGGRGVGLDNPTVLLFDGKADAPPNPWMSWGTLVGIDFRHGPFSLEIDASPVRLRVTTITLAEDAAHPESWMWDARLEYWADAQKAWLFAQYLTSDAALHSHKLARLVEAAKFRFNRPDRAGWPVGSLRLA